MKICALIMAHKNAIQLSKMIDALSHPMIDIYLHVDKKWHLSNEEINLISSRKVFVIKKRVSCYLDEWSLIEATLLLISEAKKNFDYNYYALFSGQDYPIKPINTFVEKLSKNYPRPFIDVTPYDKSNWIYNKFCYTPLHQILLEITSRMQKLLKRRIIGAVRFRKTLDKLIPRKYVLYNRLMEQNISLYGGSAWWVLPDVAINELLEDIRRNSEIVYLFKKSQTPEETFFQTFVMRSSVANMVQINPISEKRQNCLTYANFETPTKKVVGHPHILLAEDWEWLKKRPEFFARKFDLHVDEKIFRIIDEEIN